MKVSIFTEGTDNRGSPESNLFKNYFKGPFLPLRKIEEELQANIVEYHFITSEFGYVKGAEYVEDLSSPKRSCDAFIESLYTSLSAPGVVVISLTKPNFEKLIVSNWPELVKECSTQILCLCCSQRLLDEIEYERLPEETEVITYCRKGVAPIDIDTRNTLIEAIDQEMRVE
jgi:hypothetical protein